MSSNPEALSPANLDLWDTQRNTIHSHNGGWRIGEGVFCHGYDMMNDLVGKTSYFQVMMLNILGYLPERRLADWFEAAYTCLSWPDPRIWCNQIGALAGSNLTTAVAATTAGILAGDSVMYGQYPLIAGAEFIQSALRKVETNVSIDDLIHEEITRSRGKVTIMGYARPIATGDERIPAMVRVTEALGFSTGKHLQLAYEIETILKTEYRECMNINGYMSAFLSDQGLSPESIYRICAILITSGITACYVDAQQRPPGTFLPLRCDDIDYQGKAPRPVPERNKS